MARTISGPKPNGVPMGYIIGPFFDKMKCLIHENNCFSAFLSKGIHYIEERLNLFWEFLTNKKYGFFLSQFLKLISLGVFQKFALPFFNTVQCLQCQQLGITYFIWCPQHYFDVLLQKNKQTERKLQVLEGRILKMHLFLKVRCTSCVLNLLLKFQASNYYWRQV